MKNLKYFAIWWLQRVWQKVATQGPELLGHFFAVANAVSWGALVVIAILFAAVAVQGIVLDVSPVGIYEILAKCALVPIVFIVTNYFRKQWVEWRCDQARLLTTLGKK